MEIIIRAEHIIDDGCIMSRSGNDARTGQALVQKALLEDGNISTEQITTADVKPLRCFFCFLYDRFIIKRIESESFFFPKSTIFSNFLPVQMQHT